MASTENCKYLLASRPTHELRKFEEAEEDVNTQLTQSYVGLCQAGRPRKPTLALDVWPVQSTYAGFAQCNRGTFGPAA
jgi:hypothetical protein